MRPRFIALVWLCLMLGRSPGWADDASWAIVTNVSQLPQLAGLNLPVNYQFQLAGDVLWANGPAGEIVLQDDSGMALLEMDLRGQPVSASHHVRLSGNGTVTHSGGRYRLGVNGPVVDNDGLHAMQEKSGACWLRAGRHPLRLDWFNRAADYGLTVEYSGPGLPRQPIPDAALFRPARDDATQATSRVNGLDYECVAMPDEILSSPGQRTVLKTGVTRNFDISVCSRPDYVGLKFSGYLAVPQDGVYTFYTRSDDGSRLFVDAPSLRLEVVGQVPPTTPHVLALGQPVETECQWAQVSGLVAFVSAAVQPMELELRAGANRMRVQITDAAGLASGGLLGRRVRATGICLGSRTPDGQKIADTLLVPEAAQLEILAADRVEPAGTNGDAETLPVLRTAAQVHRLKRGEAQRGHRVEVQGVVTCVLPDHAAFTIQDDSRGMYVVDMTTNRSRLPAPGDFLAIQGTTGSGEFAPIVNVTGIMDLGYGHLPEPVRPTWDQLFNGSLDAQYVELEGIITALNPNGITLLMREGRINIDELRVPGMSVAALAPLENALVKIRGCLFADWDYLTHEVKAGELRIYGATLSVERPAPADLFATPAKKAGELLLFDPQAGVLSRVKVAGQMLHVRDTEGFMTDGQSGLRFFAKPPLALAAGDEVEVVGFPELSGVSPVLREAVARKTGHAPLPQADLLAPTNLIQSRLDSTRVRVRGVLVSIRANATEQLLEIQSGVRTFVARWSGQPSLAATLQTGSLLELTGIYAGQGGNPASGQDISSFELLLNQPADIRVLARPPWWNLQRLLYIVGALAGVLAITGLWITQLHRKVEARTAELEIQIKERQRVEQQRAMEQERARVAQDLHDELGSSLTEISMLAARARSAAATDERRKNHLEQMHNKAREIVVALDEIVWAMNPRHDSLGSLVSYFSLYADRFLGLANIAWRLEQTSLPPDFVVDSRCRHQLFLAFKEALTNVVRHSRATEVKLRIGLEAGELQLTIADNGCGLSGHLRTENMDGVANMQARVEKLGGRFELHNQPRHGLTLRFCLPAHPRRQD